MRRFGTEGWWIRATSWALALGVALGARATETGGDVAATAAPRPQFDECPDGAWCSPIRLSGASALMVGDTRGVDSMVDAYGCNEAIDESGGEVVYELALDAETWVRAAVEGQPGSDPDLHVLSGVGPGGCRARGDDQLSVVLPAGHWWLVVDAWQAKEGTFDLNVEQRRIPGGRCATTAREQTMHWTECAEGMDCARSPQGVIARLPAAGPVAREAHLRTEADLAWPTSGDDSLDAHYRASRYVMARREPWAPSPTGEGWAKPSFGKPLPVAAETWYVNMFWRDKPRPGERMILWSPETGRAVVGAAGYETGPRANASLGGASEEVHHALGTRHLDEVVMGFAADQTLPFGPIACD